MVRKDGGLFSDEEQVQVNYRPQGNRYIVDSIFDKAILVAGVGSSQDRVTIKRSNKCGSFYSILKRNPGRLRWQSALEKGQELFLP